jgi:hypothetical protein
MEDVEGHELMEGYESMMIEPTNFTNQRVLIVGGWAVLVAAV